MTILERSAAHAALWVSQGKRCAVLGHPIPLDQAMPLGGTRLGNIVAGALGGLLVDSEVFIALNTSEQSNRPVEIVTFPPLTLGQDFLAKGVAVWYTTLVRGLADRATQERCLALLYWTWDQLQRHAIPLGVWSQAQEELVYTPFPVEEIRWVEGQGIQFGLWPRALTIYFRSQHQCLKSLEPVEPTEWDCHFIQARLNEVNILEGLFHPLDAATQTLRTFHRLSESGPLPLWVLNSIADTRGIERPLRDGDLDRIDQLNQYECCLPISRQIGLTSTLFGRFPSRMAAMEDCDYSYPTLPKIVTRNKWIPYLLKKHHGQLSFWLDFMVENGLTQEEASSTAASLVLGAAEALVQHCATGLRTVRAFGVPQSVFPAWRERGWKGLRSVIDD